MNFRSLVIGLGVGVVFAPAATAVDIQYHAITVGGTAKQGTVIASGIRWQCDANGCWSTGPWPVPGVGACKALAQQVGAIRSYGHSKSQLNAAQLAQCNAGLPDASKFLARQTMKTTPAPQPTPAPTGKPTSMPSKPGSFTQPMLDHAQVRQVITLRSRNYDALARARRDAIADAKHRAEQAEHDRIGANTHYGDDCDDTRADINPRAAEICDNRDNNCNGRVDEGQTLPRFLDADGDGHGDPATRIDVCPADISAAASAGASGGAFLVELGNDCDDHNPDVWHDCH